MRFTMLFSWFIALIKFIKRCICGRKKIKDEGDNTKIPSSVLVQQSSTKQEVEILNIYLLDVICEVMTSRHTLGTFEIISSINFLHYN